MLDFIMGIIMAIWLTWLVLKLIIYFDDDVDPDGNIEHIINYIIDFCIFAIFVVWLIFRFKV